MKKFSLPTRFLWFTFFITLSKPLYKVGICDLYIWVFTSPPPTEHRIKQVHILNVMVSPKDEAPTKTVKQRDMSPTLQACPYLSIAFSLSAMILYLETTNH